MLSLASESLASGRGCISTAWCPGGGSEPRGGLVFPYPPPGVSRLLGMAVALLRAPRCGLGCRALHDRSLDSRVLPAAVGGGGPGEGGPPARLPPPSLLALLAAAAGALAARPIRSLCVQRTETKQNKLVSWPEQRRTRQGGALHAAPCLSPPPRGPGCRQPHPVGYFFIFGILRNR